MKKLFCYMVAVMVIAVIPLVSVEVYAGWELYDDFNLGVIDPTRWDIDESCATITPVFGAVRFQHKPGFPEDSSWLIIKQSPETVKAIKVRVMVQSCTGDVRARIATWFCKLGDNNVWSQIAVQGGLDRIYGALDEQIGPDEWLTLYWGRFEYPLDIIGKIFTIGTTFGGKEVIYYVKGLGMGTFKVFETVSPPDQFSPAIGTRSTNGEGPCVVFFDDVYVLR